MKMSLVATAVLTTAAAPSAIATTASEREYQRGHNDCFHGHYDQNQHGASYKKGCRAAEDNQTPSPPSAQQGHATTKSASKAKISDLKNMDSVKDDLERLR